VHNLPERVETILIQALARDPNQRFGNMDEFIRALNELLERPDSTESNKFQAATINESAASKIPPSGSAASGQSIPPTSVSQPDWLAWGAGILGLCLLGFLAVYLIVRLGAGKVNEVASANVSPAANVATTVPALPVANEPSLVSTDTSIPPTDFPTLVSVDTPTLAPPDIPSTNTPGCNPRFPSRIQPNRDARVCTENERVIVRFEAGSSSPEQFRIYPGATIFILEGPVCLHDEADNEDYWWWKLKIYAGTPFGYDTNIAPTWNPMGITEQDVIGWAREGWDATDKRFICQ
jgi:hypothetical protein